MLTTISETPSAQGEKWTPNKKDCDQLRNEYPYAFKNAGDVIPDRDQAKVASLVEAGLATYRDPGREYGGSVYRTEGGYSYTEPTRGRSDSWGNLWERRRTYFKDNVVYYHSHNFIDGSKAFSDTDIRHAEAYGMALLVNPQYELRALTPSGAQSEFTYPYYAFGEQLEGAPSPSDTQRIIQCRDAGL